MKLLDCDVRWPGFGPFTLAVAIAVGLWCLLFFSGLGSKTAVGAGANLAAIVFGSMSNAIGIDVTKGWKPLLLNITGCAVVLLVYRLVASFLNG